MPRFWAAGLDSVCRDVGTALRPRYHSAQLTLWRAEARALSPLAMLSPFGILGTEGSSLGHVILRCSCDFISISQWGAPARKTPALRTGAVAM